MMKILIVTEDGEFGRRLCRRLSELGRGIELSVLVDERNRTQVTGEVGGETNREAQEGVPSENEKQNSIKRAYTVNSALPERLARLGAADCLVLDGEHQVAKLDGWDSYGFRVILQKTEPEDTQTEGEKISDIYGGKPEIRLWRYRPADRILRKILDVNRELSGVYVCAEGEEAMKVYAFYSPFGGSGTTAVALTFARLMALNTGKRVLFAAGTSGYRSYLSLDSEGQGSSYRFRYYLSQEKLESVEEYAERDALGVDHITAGENLDGLLRHLANSREYESVIVDGGSVLPEHCDMGFLVLSAWDARCGELFESGEPFDKKGRLRRGRLGVEAVLRKGAAAVADGSGVNRQSGLWGNLQSVDNRRTYTILNGNDYMNIQENCAAIPYDKASFSVGRGMVNIALDRDFAAAIRQLLREVNDDE